MSLEAAEFLSSFGLSQFRPGQRDVIDAVIAGKDCMCIMPTGGGKSLCYQLPSVAREGTTIVVSPLIALMKDQVDSLAERNIPATLINSSISPADQWSRLQNMEDGKYNLVYIAPERLRSSAFMSAAAKTQIQLLAIDEAHCISQWGHDFRPDYARLGRLRKRLNNPQTIALTATATKTVREDICNVLDLHEPAVFVSGFARENLRLAVQRPDGNSVKDQRLVSFIKNTDGAGIVYAATRKNCEHIVELLKRDVKRRVEYYHAGLEPDERRTVQEEFMSGKIPIIVATNAFGMGVDKPDLRFVVHYNLPGSLEAYYQEAGRAGRDGKPSTCLMLFSFQDRFIQKFFIDNSYPEPIVVKEVYEFLRSLKSDPIELTLGEVKGELGLSLGNEGIANCENLLEKNGALERLDSAQNMAAIKISSDLGTLLDLLPRDARSQRHVMRGLEKIVGDLRYERVFFNPKKLAESLEMKWDAVQRAIRQINKLEAVDYVPPFRGRAIHLLKPDVPFDELDIDFSELDRRKNAEYRKLDLVVAFAQSNRCRQLEILEYFGDANRRLCQRCDNCDNLTPREIEQNEERAAISEIGDGSLYAIQVALSGAARTHGRFGKTLIAQMLTGSTAKKIKQLGLHKISTFGLLQRLKQTEVTKLLEMLITAGLLQQSETTRFRPVVSITAEGVEIMKGNGLDQLIPFARSDLASLLEFRFSKSTPIRNEEKEELETPDLGRESARESGEAPSPTPDLFELSQASPEDELDEEDYAALQRELAEETESVTSRIDAAESGENQRIRPSFYWTWRLISDGYSVNEVEQIRNLSHQAVLDHILIAIENDFAVDLDSVLTNEAIHLLENLLSNDFGQSVSQLHQKSEGAVSVQEANIFHSVRKKTDITLK